MVRHGTETYLIPGPACSHGGTGAPTVFPTGKSAAIFHCPTRQCICPGSNLLTHPLSLPGPSPPPCVSIRERTLSPVIMFSLFTGLYGARCRKSGGTELRAAPSATSNP
ncbi:hypothetical protein WN55_08303 [Dufourea novaeangliae]|uniref:Uncharacterized protein n=1 Tax=Dufourea novaeangliae TaxID=178035 RepID=A0A154P6P0_DUFNO|nr:hypothetical protein WN55_08303 [Dufourea novaeangliae]